MPAENKDTQDTESIINIWYGSEQQFGQVGNAQRQINILGNLNIDTMGIEAYYFLNNIERKFNLTLGSDLHRLARQGDFNVEIDRIDLFPGENTVHLFIDSGKKVIDKRKIIINYKKGHQWPLPYEIKWSEVENIQDVVEIIDGDWKITDSGVRTSFKYYDRVLAFGDSAWRNYEVETTVVFHDYSPPVKGPPTYNVSHVAIASRWPGHDNDDLQPNRKWHPLGATSEFRITDNYDSCRWRIFDGENFQEEQGIEQYRQIKPEVLYRMKHRVMDLSGTETQYSVKFWEDTETEPEEWDFQAVEVNEKRESGSALLIAHNTDVTFGEVFVIPIKTP